MRILEQRIDLHRGQNVKMFLMSECLDTKTRYEYVRFEIQKRHTELPYTAISSVAYTLVSKPLSNEV